MPHKRYASLTVLLLLLSLLSSCHRAAQDAAVAEELPHISGSPVYGASTLENLIAAGNGVFYGVVTEKSDEVYEHITNPSLEYGWLYHEVTVEILDCYQEAAGIATGNTFTYRELGGENERYRFSMEGIPCVSVGDLVVILGKENTFLTPFTLLSVSDGVVSVPAELLGDAALISDVITESSGSAQLTLEDFRALVGDIAAALDE